MSTTVKRGISFTRIDNDRNGNPRYVVHFLDFLSKKEQAHTSDQYGEGLSIDQQYALAVKKAKSIGGKKFHNKQYGGGIMIQSYNIDDDAKKIIELRNKKDKKKGKSLGSPQSNTGVNINIGSKKDFVFGFVSAAGLLGLYAGYDYLKKRNKCKNRITTTVSQSATTSTPAKSVEVVVAKAEPGFTPVLKTDQVDKLAEFLRQSMYVNSIADMRDQIQLLLLSLRLITNIADWKLVDDKFKQIDTLQPIEGRKNLSIMEKIKGTYYKGDMVWKPMIEMELKRIGLSQDATGEWLSGTLSGLSGSKRVITLSPLVASFPNMTAGQPFPQGVDLGTEIDRHNGIVTVLTYNNKIMYVAEASVL